ncbi:MAG: anhydro-N-acetylmuramic acid kinase [Burkholderiaceae bacterium]
MPEPAGHPYYIGIMSGTSIDGVDAVLADFSCPEHPVLTGMVSLPMPAALRSELLALNIPGTNELERAALAANELAMLYAHATQAVLDQTGVSSNQVRAIGAHGQTVRHAPQLGYTIQLNAPAVLAHATGIPVIADFRSRDVAGGGQGAPLVPAFHHALFGTSTPRAVLNLGGMANVTLLRPGAPVIGFDTGPANVLLDLWIHEHRGLPYDAQGAWASSGESRPALVEHLIHSEPWFALPGPKSTGRDLFSRQWLMQRLDHFYATFAKGRALNPADVQASLQTLTVESVSQALAPYLANLKEVLVCGGGALNTGMMAEFQRRLPCKVGNTADAGIPVTAVEGMAFAWLAWAHDNEYAAGLPEITGTQRPVVLGCRYPA